MSGKILCITALLLSSILTVAQEVAMPKDQGIPSGIHRGLDVETYGRPSPKLTPVAPWSELPTRKITTEQFRVLPDIDTVRMDHIFDSISSPSAISFKPVSSDFRQMIAVQRNKDWLLLDWSIFSLSAPAGLKMNWIDVNGTGSPELMLSVDKDQNVEQILGSIRHSGTEYSYESRWRRAKGFCIIDVDAVEFLVDNIYTGYEFIYKLDEYFEGPRNNGPGYVYPDAGHKNPQKKTINVWYDFVFDPQGKAYRVKLKQCETVITRESSIHYTNKPEKDVIAKPVTTKADNCTLMYLEGVYIFQSGKFRKQ